VRIFGVDPGSQRTGYGCIETDGSRHRVIVCGVLTPPGRSAFPEKLVTLHRGLTDLLATHQPETLAIEDLFYAKNARSASQLGHVRGVLMLAAAQAGVPISEYSPTEVKRAVVGYGRAEKAQVQQLVTLLLGLDEVPSPLDVSDALAVAICHSHSLGPTARRRPRKSGSWRRYRPEPGGGP
jgi:crossover junction endodeoxyribonuclease RuvC